MMTGSSDDGKFLGGQLLKNLLFLLLKLNIFKQHFDRYLSMATDRNLAKNTSGIPSIIKISGWILISLVL